MTDIVTKALDNPIFPAIGLAIAATAGALWVAGAWWTYKDAAWRTGSSFLGLLASAWIVISSPLLLPLSLGVYAFVRPQVTAAEKRSRRLVAELVAQLDADAETLCPRCAAPIDREWLRCPECASWLAAPCANCGGWAERDIEICPWCGSEDREQPQVEVLRPAAAVAPARKARRRQSRRQQQAAMTAYEPRLPRGRWEAMLDVRPPARAGSR